MRTTDVIMHVVYAAEDSKKTQIANSCDRRGKKKVKMRLQFRRLDHTYPEVPHQSFGYIGW